VPFVQYVACLAVVSALQRLFSERLGTTASPRTFPVKIKWPNDIYAVQGGRSLKIGGILCQSCNVLNHFSIVAGVGLNLDNAEPTTCVNALLAVEAEACGVGVAPVTREEVLAVFLNDFELLMEVRVGADRGRVVGGRSATERDAPLQVLRSKTFEALAGTYQRYWMHRDQQLSLEDPDDAVIRVRCCRAWLVDRSRPLRHA